MHCNLFGKPLVLPDYLHFFFLLKMLWWTIPYCCVYLGWFPWMGGIAESKGMCIFWGFWYLLPNCLQKHSAPRRALQQSRLLLENGGPAGSLLSGDAAWVTHGRSSFSQSGFSVFLFFPFVSFLGFLPNSLLWKDRLINPVLINNLKLHSVTVHV